MRATQSGWMAAATVAMTFWSGSASAADPPRAARTTGQRRLVVSISDRKLALIENEVVTVFPVAVGAPSSPSPTGSFTIVNRIPNPTYYKPGKVVGPGAA